MSTEGREVVVDGPAGAVARPALGDECLTVEDRANVTPRKTEVLPFSGP